MTHLKIHIPREMLELAREKDDTIEIDLIVEPPHDTVSAPPAPPISPRPRGPLASLMSNGRLAAGDRLAFTQPRANRMAYATVRADGGLEVEGKTGVYWSPSKAAAAITGSQANGWILWRRADDGRTLDELRTEDGESKEFMP